MKKYFIITSLLALNLLWYFSDASVFISKESAGTMPVEFKGVNKGFIRLDNIRICGVKMGLEAVCVPGLVNQVLDDCAKYFPHPDLYMSGNTGYVKGEVSGKRILFICIQEKQYVNVFRSEINGDDLKGLDSSSSTFIQAGDNLYESRLFSCRSDAERYYQCQFNNGDIIGQDISGSYSVNGDNSLLSVVKTR